MDIKYLKTIYKYKCMTVSQLFSVYKEDNAGSIDDFIKDIICPAIFKGIIELCSIENVDDYMIFLKTIGINMLICSDRTIKYKAKQLKISPVLFSHQIELVNCFMIIEKYYANIMKISFDVYHDKYTYVFDKVYPDGLISSLALDLFIEIDMATETTKRLDERICNYSSYVYNTKRNKATLVLFVMHNATEQRIQKLFRLISEKKSLFLSNKIEFAITYPTYIIECIEKKLLKEEYLRSAKNAFNESGFVIVDNNDEIYDYNADFYAFKTDENKKLSTKNNRPAHFLVRYCPYLYSVAKALDLSAVFLRRYIDKYRKDINFLILVPEENEKIKEIFYPINTHYSIIITDKENIRSKINEV